MVMPQGPAGHDINLSQPNLRLIYPLKYSVRKRLKNRVLISKRIIERKDEGELYIWYFGIRYIVM